MVGECRTNSLGGTLKIAVLAVPGHRYIEGNERRAEELASWWSAVDIPTVYAVGVPLPTVKREIYSHYCIAVNSK